MRDNRGTFMELSTQNPVFMLPDMLKVQCIELSYFSDNTISGSDISHLGEIKGGYIK